MNTNRYLTDRERKFSDKEMIIDPKKERRISKLKTLEKMALNSFRKEIKRNMRFGQDQGGEKTPNRGMRY